jgi:hypothetical protein
VRYLRYVILLLAAAQAACDDPYGPRFWSDLPDTATVFSSSRIEHVGQPSAYDFIDLRGVPIELPGITGQWDVALADVNGALALVPAGEFDGITSRAGIAVFPNAVLDDITTAPRDTAAFRMTAVAVEPATVYVIRTRRASCGFGTTGVRYAKLRPIEIDALNGTLRFEVVRNPYCNDRSFIPPAP